MTNTDNDERIPLAERCRPKKLSEIVGQEKILSAGSLLYKMLDSGRLSSFILWGPPGSGKTTIARLVAASANYNFIPFSAVFTGIKEVKQVMREAESQLNIAEKPTVIFIDEIHRFNKAQQDAFLPYIEQGSIILIGATTENPSFEVISALLSRCHVFVLEHLETEHLFAIMKRAVERFNPHSLVFPDEILELIAGQSSGDARKALNNIEALLMHHPADKEMTVDSVSEVLSDKTYFYDKTGEEHYNIISALHKSLRGSDPQAGLFWLARMVESGEDPLYIARRLVRFASEDVGLADPNALVQAIAAKDAVHFLGYPEANTALAQLVVYLATAPKSNALYTAYGKAAKDAKNSAHAPVPLHIRNAPTDLMKNLNYGKNYQYDHDHKYGYYYQKYFPDELKEKSYYRPSNFGFEKEIRKRLAWWKKLREEQKNR